MARQIIKIGRKVTTIYAIKPLDLIQGRGDMNQDVLSQYVPSLGSQQNISLIESQQIPHSIEEETIEQLQLAGFKIEFYDL